jgi:hypothetical protein
MSIGTIPRKVMAVSICLLLASCSATQHVSPGPVGPHDVSRYILIVHDAPGGKALHEWKPLRDVDRARFQYPARDTSARRGFVHVSSTGRDQYCEGRRTQCEADCLRSRRPFPVGHLLYPEYEGPWSKGKQWWCPRACRMLADMCRRGMGEWAEDHSEEFGDVDSAVDWVKSHREEILVGTVIVIAGVAFIAVGMVAGVGALVFVPLVTMTEAPLSASPDARIAGVVP